jgi:hypothetical protein
MMRLLLFASCVSLVLANKNNNPPVIFIYTLLKEVCASTAQYNKAYPRGYGRHTLLQAVSTQPDGTTVMLASNFNTCPQFHAEAAAVPGVTLLDTDDVASNRTAAYARAASRLVAQGSSNDTVNAGLYLASALRFFLLEDIMRTHGLAEAFHVELDNLLYTPLSAHLPTLRRAYATAVTVTPLTPATHGLTTASVVWVPQIAALTRLTTFLHAVATVRTSWNGYLAWAKTRIGCCKSVAGAATPAGAPKAPGTRAASGAIRPFFINEMTMLTFYRELRGAGGIGKLLSFPVLPHGWGAQDYGGGGRFVGPSLGQHIVDPGSYGQFLGGTHRSRLKPGFTDTSHIVGQAFQQAGGQCTVQMRCKRLRLALPAETATVPNVTATAAAAACSTAPFVRCGAQRAWVPLLNLHVHSKKTQDFLSHPCKC